MTAGFLSKNTCLAHSGLFSENIFAGQCLPGLALRVAETKLPKRQALRLRAFAWSVFSASKFSLACLTHMVSSSCCSDLRVKHVVREAVTDNLVSTAFPSDSTMPLCFIPLWQFLIYLLSVWLPLLKPPQGKGLGQPCSLI